MRAYQVLAIVAVILIGFSVKLIFFNPPVAEADSVSIQPVRMDISQLHQNAKNIPIQTIHDMSFVFANGD
jgi:hypothetical protein